MQSGAKHLYCMSNSIGLIALCGKDASLRAA